MGSSGEVAIWTNTNMGTHIVMAVSPDISAAAFKREVERKHLSFFPKLGEIKAHGLMVRRKNCLYHLPESLPIKYAFQGLKGMWFLHVEVQPLNNSGKMCLSHCIVANNYNLVSDSSNAKDCFVTNNEKHNMHCGKPLGEDHSRTIPLFIKKGEGKEKHDVLKNKPHDIEKECSNVNGESLAVDNESIVFQISRDKVKLVIDSFSPVVETTKQRSPEVISIGDIIDVEGPMSRCCDPQSPNVTSIAMENQLYKQLKGARDDNYSNKHAYPFPKFEVVTPPKIEASLHCSPPGPGSSGNGLERTAAVGRRILIASNNLRISQDKQRPVISFYQFRGTPRVPSVSRISAFEISDSDD